MLGIIRRRLSAAFQRRVVEKLPDGVRRRFARKVMDSREDLYRFWSQPEPPDNAPQTYIPPVESSMALHGLIAPDLASGASILEVGCNVGRNLGYLAERGYRVEGIEISEYAVKLLRETYPVLADVPIHLGPAEEVLPRLRGSYDLVFTMAVLMHIHPDSTIVFDHMARLTKNLLVIEPSPSLWASTHRAFPHDYRRIFRKRGFRIVWERPMADVSPMAPDLTNYTAWRLRRD